MTITIASIGDDDDCHDDDDDPQAAWRTWDDGDDDDDDGGDDDDDGDDEDDGRDCIYGPKTGPESAYLAPSLLICLQVCLHRPCLNGPKAQ